MKSKRKSPKTRTKINSIENKKTQAKSDHNKLEVIQRNRNLYF